MGLQPLAKAKVKPVSDAIEGFETAAGVHGMIRLYMSVDGINFFSWCASPSLRTPLPPQQLALLLP